MKAKNAALGAAVLSMIALASAAPARADDSKPLGATTFADIKAAARAAAPAPAPNGEHVLYPENVQSPLLLKMDPKKDSPFDLRVPAGKKVTVLEETKDMKKVRVDPLDVERPDGLPYEGWVPRDALTQSAVEVPPQTGSVYRQRFAACLRGFVGVPYTWGNNDCSGIMQKCFYQSSAPGRMPRTAEEQFRSAPYRPAGAPLQVGDMVFYKGARGRRVAVGHVAAVVEPDQRMVEAVGRKAGIREDAFKPGLGYGSYFP